MGKRTTFEDQSRGVNSPRNSKRQKTGASHDSDAHQVNGSAAYEITSARDLQRALVFDQSSPADIRSGLSLLKSFLDSILYPTEDYDVPRRRAILREYLDTQKGRGNDAKDKTFLPSLIQIWDFAAETNAEAILAQVTAVLALLLKVFTSHGDFLEYGTLLCKTILQPSVARRLVRSTSAASNKENVIAPALRLLTQLTGFNEGAHARAVYAKRDFTLEPKLLGRNISLGKEQSVSDHVKKPTIRTTAIRYLLTHLRFQDERAKSEILGNTNITRAIFDRLQTDPPFLIQEIFSVFTDHVFKDKTIARHVKSRILNGRTLSRIAALYSYDAQGGSLSDGQKAPDALAHDFLRLVCTDPAFGVMLPTNGFYLSTVDDNDGDQEDLQEHDQMVDILSLDSKASRIRNTILSDFIHGLRPYANTLHQELITDIFRACPELTSEYFVKRRDFSYDPKLTATWIGYSAFLYQTIQLPVPRFFGWKRGYADGPPSVSVLMQSIIPQPLNQQVLTKCLNHSSDLVQLFAVRVLLVALVKLRSVLEEAKAASASKSSKLWGQLSKHLVTEFGRRCPPIRTLFLALKKPGLKDMKRESITRLLRLYYEILPHVALQEKFDVSLPLCSALVEVEKCAEGSEEKVFRVMELEHWTQMAKLSPAMRWWQKQKTLQNSPFVTLLKLLVTSKENELFAGIKSLLVDILQGQELLQMQSSPNALEVLLASLGPSSGSSALSPEVFDFLDDCCARFIQVPIKYFDDLDALCAQHSQTSAEIGPFSPVLMTLVEQWPFQGGNAKTSASAEAIAQWLARLLYLLKLVGEDDMILQSVRDALVGSADSTYKGILGDAFLWKMGKERAKESLKLATGADFSGSDRSTPSPSPEHTKPSLEATWKIDLEAPPAEDKKHTGLMRWRKKELSEAIDDGDIGALLLCICSEHAEIRLQAVNGIRQLAASIAVSNRSGEANFHGQLPTISNLDLDVQHMYLLLGEILESVDPSNAVAFPYVGAVLAGRIVSILADPTHSLFSTVNKFLTTSPVWNVDTLIRYFWHHIVTSEPDDDSRYHEEVDWFLDYLLDALRTGPDMEIFRKSNIFEQLLTHYGSRSCSSSAKTKIVRLLLRATHVGGSTTLITRCGLITWIEIILDGQDAQHRALKTLAARLYQTCDRERVGTWSSGSLLERIPAIVGEETWSRVGLKGAC